MDDGRIPKLFARAKLLDLPEAVLQSLDGVIDKIKENRPVNGIVFEGTNGTGKSYAACAFAHDLKEWGTIRRPAVFVPAALLPELWGTDDTYREQPWIETLLRSECLIIDDLGKESRQTEYQISKAISRIGAVIRSRVQTRRFTIITTNLEPERIEKEYGPSVHSLMHEVADAWVLMEGRDRRLGD